MGIAARQTPISNRTRAFFGFALGFLVMVAAVHILTVNRYDFDNIQRGVRSLIGGINPWAPESRVPDFYNPPFSILYLWPVLFTTPQTFLVLGAACLFALVFYHRAWVALAWFATNTALWVIAAGNIDILVIGAGLLLLLTGDMNYKSWPGLLCRVAAYGLLMVKPQGAFFIVALYILLRRDWKGLLISLFVFGLLFLPLYPDWLKVVLFDPPLAQTEASHTLWAKFGPYVAGIIAAAVIFARRWKYWQLGGALAGILMPYGMPGLPIFLILSGVESLRAIPIVVIWSGLLASLTWLSPPPGVNFYDFLSPFMAIYHLCMLGLALVMACLSRGGEDRDTVDFGLMNHLRQLLDKKTRVVHSSGDIK